jgi:hypothetical protein
MAVAKTFMVTLVFVLRHVDVDGYARQNKIQSLLGGWV